MHALPDNEEFEGKGAAENDKAQEIPIIPPEKPATVWVILSRYFIYVVWAFQYFELKEEKKLHRADNERFNQTLEKQINRAEADKKELRRENTMLLHRNWGADTTRGARPAGAPDPQADGGGTDGVEPSAS